MNLNMLKGLGLVMTAGAIGGYLAQKIFQKKYAKVLEMQEEQHKKDLLDVKMIAVNEMKNEAEKVIRDAVTKEIRDDMALYVQKQVEAMDFKEIVDEGVRKGIRTATDLAEERITKESLYILKEEILERAEATVDDHIKEEMYQVNGRRIIEDAVDRAVREEVRIQVRDQVKKFNIPSWFDGDDIAKVLRAL